MTLACATKEMLRWEGWSAKLSLEKYSGLNDFNNRHIVLTLGEDQSPMSRCQQAHFLMRDIFLIADICLITVFTWIKRSTHSHFTAFKK